MAESTGRQAGRPEVPDDAVDQTMEGVPIPEKLVEMLVERGAARVEKVTDGVYVALAYGLANSILLEGPDGLVVVDTMDSEEAATRVYKAFREVSQKPIKAIIYTHHHADHTKGTRVFIEDPSNPPDVWAHELFQQESYKMASIGAMAMMRGARQFGVNLMRKGTAPARLADSVFRMTTPRYTPTHLVKGDNEEVNIAGLNLVLMHIPGETDDQMGVWLPDKRVMLPADNIYQAFPNLSAIRGTTNRDVPQWARSLTKIQALRPLHLVVSHTMPIEGEERIYRTLGIYHDAIMHVHDETLRYMNQGLHPEGIVRKVKLPEHMASHPYLQELYGTVEWSVRGIFCAYAGWFSGDPVDLSPMTPQEKAVKMVGLFGGVAETAQAAEKAMKEDEVQWALELASHALRMQPNNKLALSVRFQAEKVKGVEQTSFNGRNYYLSCAAEDKATAMGGTPRL